MSNKTEREAFYAYGESIGMPRLMLTIGEFKAFQAGAAYQREQEKKLVEALKLSRAYMVEEAKYEEQAFNELRIVDAALAACGVEA